MSVFVIGFILISIVCCILYWFATKLTNSESQKNEQEQGALVEFSNFQHNYLLVYLFAAAADWLQGPYVYALYEHYGLSSHEIELLFVGGFGSSLFFGTVIGSLADKYGRRKNCVAYSILYGISCITKHFNNFWLLMVGRVLGGIATSILFSAFESWFIYEFNKRGFQPHLQGVIFSNAVLGNSIVAIISGVLAQKFADYFGFVAPFDLSLIVLLILGVLLLCTWTENYGDRCSEESFSFKDAFHAIHTDPKILYLGIVQSLFEGAMYIFVLEWTPALTPKRNLNAPPDTVHIPHGYIFSSFMVAIMVGSSLFKIVSIYFSIESFLRCVLLLSAVSLLTPIIFPNSQLLIFIGFLIFEICIGIFWPSLSTLRGKYLPESTRATVMNFFRIPLNLIVILILSQNFSLNCIFSFCILLNLMATIFMQLLFRQVVSV